MRTCLISPEASQDLNKIFDYFASNNVEAGERFVIAFEKKCEKLLRFPNIGRSYQDIESSLRGIPLDNYLSSKRRPSATPTGCLPSNGGILVSHKIVTRNLV